jgi:CDP-diacylglycerol--serine O-phosphatidyltransferase
MTANLLRRWFEGIYRNLPNIVSILGVVPLSLLLVDGGFAYLPGLIVYNNFMDDLDGILARKLRLSSDFGARLDNVADAAAHILIVLVVGAHYQGTVLALSMVAAGAILIRIVGRLAPTPGSGAGTPTNELMRHLLLLVVLENAFDVDISVALVAVLLLNVVSMLAPFTMRHLVRARAKSVVAVLGVNAVLAAAWVGPEAAPSVAAVCCA